MPRKSLIVDFDLFVISRTGQVSESNAKFLARGSQSEKKYSNILQMTESYVLENIITVAANSVRRNQTWSNFTVKKAIFHTRVMLTELITNSAHQALENLNQNTMNLIGEARDLDLNLLEKGPPLLSKSPIFSHVFDSFHSHDKETLVPFLAFSRETEIFLYIAFNKECGTLKFASILTKNEFASDDLREKAHSILEVFDSMLEQVIRQKRSMPTLLLDQPPSGDLEEEMNGRREHCWMCLFC